MSVLILLSPSPLPGLCWYGSSHVLHLSMGGGNLSVGAILLKGCSNRDSCSALLFAEGREMSCLLPPQLFNSFLEELLTSGFGLWAASWVLMFRALIHKDLPPCFISTTYYNYQEQVYDLPVTLNQILKINTIRKKSPCNNENHQHP